MHKDGALVCVWEIKADIGAAVIRAHRPSNLWSTSSAHRISSAVIGYFLVGAAEIVRIRFCLFFSTFNMTTTRQKKNVQPGRNRSNRGRMIILAIVCGAAQKSFRSFFLRTFSSAHTTTTTTAAIHQVGQLNDSTERTLLKVMGSPFFFFFFLFNLVVAAPSLPTFRLESFLIQTIFKKSALYF